MTGPLSPDTYDRARPRAGWLALSLLVTGLGCGEGGVGESGSDTAVLAEVQGRTITEADIDARIATVPRLSQAEFTTPAGRSRMLQQVIEEEVLYLAAQDAGLARDPSVQGQVDNYRRQLLVQTYLDHKQKEASHVSEQEARAFYEEHREEYRTEKTLRARVMVLESEERASSVQGLVKHGSMTFEQATNKFCVHPQVREAGGLIPTWVREGQAIPWLGNHPEFHSAVFSLEAGEISPPFETRLGYMLARVEEVREARQRPFEEVRGDIEGRLRREKSTQALPELIAELKQRYQVKISEPERRSAEELFVAAQSANDPRQRIELYEELVRNFPKYERSLESWFMIGFIRSEELGDREGANAAFERVIELDADSELAQSARWMLTSSEDELPPFEDEPLADGTQEETQ